MLRPTARSSHSFAVGAALFACALLPACASAGRLSASYHVVDLGGPPGGSGANAVSSDGVAVGYVLLGPQMPHATIFVNGQIIDLGTFGGNASLANGVASGGRAVGWARLPDGTRHAFLFENGAMRDLGTLGGSVSNAFAINDSGTVVGSSWTAGDTLERPFLWTAAGGMREIPVPGPYSAQALAVNDAGDVAGWFIDVNQTIEAYRMRGGVVQVLPTLGPYATTASGINRNGDVVGYSYNNDEYPTFHAVLWRDGLLRDLGALVSRHSAGFAVNDEDVVVGLSYDAHGVMVAAGFDDSSVVDLNAFLPAGTPWHLDMATGITNSGEISGIGTLDGASRAFALVPDPPPPPPPPPPARLALRAWPLPMREGGTLELELPQRTRARVTLYDLAGRRVAVVAQGDYGPGRVALALPAASLSRVGSGVLWARLDSDRGTRSLRIVVAR